MQYEAELRNFLVEAKQNTYAAGGGTQAEPSRLGAKDYPYVSGNYQYLDSYVGELDFAGQEVVWKDDKSVWAMNYYGTTIDPIEGFPEFLFEALKQVSLEAPFRGPTHYSSDPFEYICFWTGGLGKFSGEEKIIYQGKVIFSLLFHGGNVKYV
ncbi:DUF5680 domain-containing protein [Paenibacillus motobuensis]|nr:DUF5680 domain-containing protein [Paenibacillus lutimineralis]MCM3646955.1 DUF5680 domain-containing protein [Paenibacillus motobuensis]